MRCSLLSVSVALLTICSLVIAQKSTNNRVGLDRPSTEAPPDVNNGNLDSLLCEVYGTCGDQGSSSDNSSPSTPTGGDSYGQGVGGDSGSQGGNGGVGNGGNGNEQGGNGGNGNGGSGNEEGGYGGTGNGGTGNEEGGYGGTGTGGSGNESGGGSTEDCTCVQYYLCSDNNTIIDDGVGIIDIRIKDSGCNDYLERCCGGANIRPPENPVTPTPVPRKSGCGNRNTQGIGFRITGDKDNEAQYGEFPWMVAVIRPDPSLSGKPDKPVNVYQCGGSLIHPEVVLTGAHCVRGKNNLVIRAGEWDTQTKNELYPTQDRRVKQVIIHEQFNNGSLANDPALLILEEPVDTSVENVGLICLPQQGEVMDNRNCVASGWGKDQFGKEGKYQVILKRVEVPIVPRQACIEALRRTRLGQRFRLHESFICAGGIRGKDTCKGDGGSPLVCPSKNNPEVYVQAGIVAWGIDCGTETPGVYVNVPYFVNWINNKLQQQGISLA